MASDEFQIDPHTNKFLLRFQQINASIKLQKEASLANKKTGCWPFILDLFIGLLMTFFILFIVLSFGNVKFCPTEFNVFRPYRGQCYRVSNNSLSWSEAQSDCHAQNGYLLEIYTKAEQEFLYKGKQFSRLNDKLSFWIGASRQQPLGQFVWDTTGYPPITQVLNWADKFPNDKTSQTSCVLLLNKAAVPP